MDAQADEAAVSGKRPADEAVPELAQLVVQLRNVVNMEREHADKLFALLIDTGSLSTDAERIAPDHRRQGLAAAACRFALYRLTQEGAERGIVYSLAHSDATALYESIGLREHARSLELVKRR